MQEMKSTYKPLAPTKHIKTKLKVVFSLLLVVLFLCAGNAAIASPEPSFDQTTYNSNHASDSAENPNITAEKSQGSILEKPATTSVEEKYPSLVDRLANRYREAQAKTQILVFFLLYFALSFISLFTFIIINRTIKTKRRQRAQRLRDAYQEQLADYLFGDDSMMPEFQDLNIPFNRNILLGEILGLHANISGESAEKLRDLYFNLGFHRDSLKKAYSRKWYVKVRGFRELAQMDFKEANEEIYRHITSKNQILRIESQIALVKLSEDNPLFFLDNMRDELSQWEQINILETINYHKIDIPTFENWLESTNQSVMVFAIKMIGVFKHTFSVEKVIQKLAHVSETVRKYAILTLIQLEMPEGIEAMKKTFDSESEKNQEIIMQGLVSLAVADDIPFLKHVLNTNTNFRVCVNASHILKNMPGGMDVLDGIYALSDDYLKKIITNVKERTE